MQAAVAWRAELLLKSAHFVRKPVYCGLIVHNLVHHRQVLAYLLQELAACARAHARLETLEAGLHRKMDAFLHELPRGPGKMASGPFRYALVDKLLNERAFESGVDEKEVEDDVGVSCRK